MLRIRVKMGPAVNRQWTCMFGIHVRKATIIIGLWHLFLNLLALGFLVIIMKNPPMLMELENGYDDSIPELDPPALPTPLSKIDPPYAYRDHSLNYTHNVDMGGLVCICMIAITLMLIYGAVKGKPSHLLPFFCLQLFDFSITTLTAAGYLCYLRSIHRIIDESHRLPWREELLKLSPQALSILVLLAFVLIVLLKAYCIGIIWRCYKFLTIRQHNLRTMLPYIIPSTRQERDYNTLLPDYDEAIAQGIKQQPPPSYTVAMSSVESAENGNNNVYDLDQTTSTNVSTGNESVSLPSTPPPYIPSTSEINETNSNPIDENNINNENDNNNSNLTTPSTSSSPQHQQQSQNNNTNNNNH